MIDAKTLLIHNANGSTTQQCAGCGAGCRESHTTPPDQALPAFPYICTACWIKGWRNRSDQAYAPGEVF